MTKLFFVLAGQSTCKHQILSYPVFLTCSVKRSNMFISIVHLGGYGLFPDNNLGIKIEYRMI